MQNVSTCLWFNNQAEEAVAFYLSLIPNSQILHTTYYLEGAPAPYCRLAAGLPRTLTRARQHA